MSGTNNGADKDVSSHTLPELYCQWVELKETVARIDRQITNNECPRSDVNRDECDLCQRGRHPSLAAAVKTRDELRRQLRALAKKLVAPPS